MFKYALSHLFHPCQPTWLDPMLAALSIQMRDYPEDAQLLQQTRQASVHEIVLRATAT
jgi:hypothetical protein